MTCTLINRLQQSDDGEKLLQQERTILEVTEAICGLMQQENVTRAELARRLGTTKGYVTQLLDGGKNMTLRTISDVFFALGREFRCRSISRDIATTERTEIILTPDTWSQVTRTRWCGGQASPEWAESTPCGLAG